MLNFVNVEFYLAIDHVMPVCMSWLVLVSLRTRIGQVCGLIPSLDL
jgi:hypothetical protein